MKPVCDRCMTFSAGNPTLIGFADYYSSAIGEFEDKS